MLQYLKAAFLNRWNLLLFGGGMGFAALSGRFDVVAPLVAAAELAYLGFLGTNSTFQNYVRVTNSPSNVRERQQKANDTSQRMLEQLPRRDIDRFDAVRTRCEELRKLSEQMAGPGPLPVPGALDDYRIEGLDKLLWMYLKLLYSRNSIAKFLKQTSPSNLLADIRETESRLAQLPPGSDDAVIQRRRQLLEETLQTSRTRLENYQKAEENFELTTLELDRLETTIHSLGELAVTRASPQILSQQIDEMSTSLVRTEEALGELRYVPSLDMQLEEVPQLLRAEVKF